MSESQETHLEATPLFAYCRELGVTMVPFTGYAMALKRPACILAEHRHSNDKGEETCDV